MTASELKRFLAARSCGFNEGKKHTIGCRDAFFTVMPRHKSAGIKTGTLRKIVKDLRIEE